jgi:bifunctional DNA primase/polymerase-like protein
MSTAPNFAFNPLDIASVNAMLQDLPDIPAAQETTPVPDSVPEPPKLSPFELRANPMAAQNVPVIPLRPRSKIAFLSNWTELATTDPERIAQIAAEYPDANCACVAYAKPGGTWFFELDKPGTRERIERETGQNMPKTFTVSSSPGKGHFYFRQNPASIALGNCQSVDATGEVWSARVDNRYVVAAGSIHPSTGKLYAVVSDAEIAPAPDWLVEWIKNDAFTSAKSGRVNASPDGPPIPRGSHDNELFRIGCMLRNAGMDYEQIKDNLVQICEKRCTDHGSDYVDMCERKAGQAVKYPVGSATPRAVLGSATAAGTAGAANAVEIPVISAVAYPEFPRWVMNGTSLYEGFIQPICAENTRFPEFMFMPSVTLMLTTLLLR